MKQCTYCGKEHLDDIEVCPIDGSPLRTAGLPPLSDRVQEKPSATVVCLGLLFLLCGLIFSIDGISGIETGTGVDTGKYGVVSGRQAFLFGLGMLIGGAWLLISCFRSRSKNGDANKT